MGQTLSTSLEKDNILKQSYDCFGSLNLETLKKYGIYRNKFDYELVYFYPPQRTLGKVNASDVFHCEIKTIQQRRNIGMYIHIPFCTGRCSYCHYVSFGPANSKVVERYIKYLKYEIKVLSNKSLLSRAELSNLHVGGGTPTCLNNKSIIGLMDYVREQLKVMEGAEITWESSPETIIGENKDKLATLLENGVNRLNIGIQAFQDNLLEICRRRHSASDAENAIRVAGESGFTNINIDVIYGLPYQTMEDWQQTLDKIEELKPESVTIYHLRAHPDTRFIKLAYEGYPPEDICLLMQIYAYERLKAIGYTQVQPCQFVLSTKSKHQYVIEKWGKGKELLGVGLSAYGFVNDYIYVNKRRLSSYIDMILSGKSPIYLGKKLSTEQKMVKALILGLKILPHGVRQQDFSQEFGITIMEAFGKALTQLENLGLVQINPISVRLTSKGILFSDEVCTKLYVEEEKAKLHKLNTKYGCYLRS